MKKSYVFLTLFALLLVFLVGLWLGVTVPRFITGGSGPRMLPSATVLRQVQTLSQLVTVKYAFRDDHEAKADCGSTTRFVIVVGNPGKLRIHQGDHIRWDPNSIVPYNDATTTSDISRRYFDGGS